MTNTQWGDMAANVSPGESQHQSKSLKITTTQWEDMAVNVSSWEKKTLKQKQARSVVNRYRP